MQLSLSEDFLTPDRMHNWFWRTEVMTMMWPVNRVKFQINTLVNANMTEVYHHIFITLKPDEHFWMCHGEKQGSLYSLMAVVIWNHPEESSYPSYTPDLPLPPHVNFPSESEVALQVRWTGMSCLTLHSVIVSWHDLMFLTHAYGAQNVFSPIKCPLQMPWEVRYMCDIRNNSLIN